jgi:hypothetical protein
MISNRPVRRLSLLAMVITIVSVLAMGSSAAQAMPVDGGTATNPWVQSDELDYAPGSTVTLSGGNWQPGENVHIFVDDTNGHTWNHSADVTADDAGEIQDVFDLPNVWVADYDVTATGSSSGTVTAAFTDSKVNTVNVATPMSVTVPVGGTAAYGTLTANLNGNNNPCTVTLSATKNASDTGLPTGAAAVFGNSPFTSTGGNVTSSVSVTTSSATTPVGTFTFHVTATDGVGCQDTQLTVSAQQLTLTVTKADQTISFGTLANKTFGDSAFTVSATGGASGNPVTFSVGATDPCTRSGSSGATITIIGVGTCTVTANQAGNASYNAASPVSRSFTIAKASSTTVVTCPVSVTYNGSAQTPCSASATGAGGLSQSPTVIYAANTTAGTATASAAFAGDANHNGSTDSKSFTIDKASSTTVVSCPVSVTFDGSAQTPCSANVTGAGGLNQSVPVSYAANTNAGTATASATFAGDANHSGSSNSKMFTIDKATSTTIVTCPVSVTYSGSAKTPCSANVTGAGGLSQLLSVTYSDNTSAGTATASASFGGDSNHKSSSDSTTFVVEKADASVSITWGASQTYDGSPHPASGSVSGVGSPAEDLGALDFTYYSGSDTSGSSLAGAPTDAGTYTVLASFAGNGNYNPASDTKTITIDKADATVSVSWADPQTYDGDPHPASGSVSGVGTPAEDLGAPVFTYYSGSDTTGTALPGTPTDAGTYTVRADFAGNGNYKPASATATITIEKASSTSVVTCLVSVTFNGSAQEPCSASVTGAGGLNQSLSVTYSDNTNVGTATASASFGGDANHKPSSDSKMFTIEKADASVSVGWADPQTYDGDPHPATGSVSGVGSPAEDLGTPEFTYYSGSDTTGSSLSGAPSDAGTYTVLASFAGNDNYNSASATKTITIEKASSTTTVSCPVSVTYSGSAKAPCSANVMGAGDLDESVVVIYSDNTDAGTATASASFGGDANHKPSGDSKTFVIEKANGTVTITWDDPQTYTGNPNPASAVVDGVGGETGLSPAAELSYYSGNDATDTALPGAPTDAGTYTVLASFAGNGNYNSASATKTITIEKSSSTTLVTCPASVTYNGSAHTPCTANVTGAGGLDDGVDVTYSDNTHAGKARASASYGGDANHKPSSDSKTFVIEKADATVTITWDHPQTYTANTHPASAVVNGVGGETDLSPAAELTYYSGDDATGAPLPGAPTDAGTYTVRADFAGNDDYKPASDTKSITIEKADASVSITWAASQTYNGNPHPASAVVDGVGGEANLAPAAELTYYGGDDTSGTALAAAPTNAGTYTALAGFAGNDNYNPAAATKTIMIDKADASVSVSWADPQTYDGDPHPATGSVSGVGIPAENLGAPGFSYYNGSDTTGTALPGAPTDAGTYTVRADFAGNGNYEPASATATITIEKASSTTLVTCPVSVTFNGLAQEPCSASVTGAGGLNQSPSLTYSDNTNAGTATASASFAGDANHKPSSDSEAFAIEKADSTTAVTCPVSLTYNGSAQEPCWANVTGAGGLDQSVPVTYSDNTNAGTATASASFGGDGNHKASSDSKTFTIAKATPTVTVSWAGWTFDRTAHPAGGSVAGVGSPAANLGAPGSFSYYGGSNATGTPLSGAPKDAGTYTVVAHFAGNGNYTAADSAEKTVTVAKADASVSITWADPQIYNGNPHAASSSVSGVGSPAEDLGSAALTYYAGSTASGAPLAGAPVAAGTYTVNTSFSGNGNYNPVSATKTITIGRAELAVKADDKTKVYNGSPFSSFTRSITGFASGDDETVISGVVTFNGSATTATNAGSYTITPGVSGLSAANYTFKPVNGTLQITKAQLTVKADNKAKPFDGLPFTAFTSTITGYVNGENSSVVSGSVTYAGNAVGATGVGTYTITPGTGGLTATNYSFTGANGTLTISAWYATGFYDPIGVDSSQFVASGAAVPTVSATGVWNTAKGGSTVPLKFNLYNATGGTQLTTTSSVQSFDLVKLTNCSGTATDDAVDYFATTGATSLRYDGTGGQFIQNWKTPSVNADSCYRVNVKFVDGSAIYSFFKLRK